MDFTLISPKQLDSIEGYLSICAMSIVSLESLEKYNIRAVELGILKEDQECLANSIVWDLRRLQKMYKDQAESLLELLPNGFDVQESLKSLSKQIKRKPKNGL